MRSSRLFPFLVLAMLPLGPDTGLFAGELNITTVDQKDTPVAELVVWLDPLDTPPPVARPEDLTAVVAQRDEEFDPYTIAVRVGTRVNFPNQDPVQHHVYSLSRPSKFEIPLHRGDVTESVIMDQVGLVPVGCNIHDWMLSYIMVVDSPWFGTTDETGTMSLAGVPAGKYKLSAWHPRLRKTDEREIEITTDGTQTIDLVFRLRPDRRLRRAPSSGGSKY